MATQSVEDNEFTSSPTGNANRPYGVGMKRHNETLATILVYKKGQSDSCPEQIAYLDEFDTKVESLTLAVTESTTGPTSLSSGAPEQPIGEITKDKLDGKNDYYGIFNNFSLLNVAESHEEIVKLHVNFSADWNAFFFGEKPRVYQFSGFFLDSMDYPYYQEFMVAYDKYLSGRKSVESKVQVKFIYDGKIVDGYMLNIATSQTAADQLIKSFQFTVLVKGFNWVRTNLVPQLKQLSDGSNKIRLIEEFNGLSNVHRLNKENLTDLISHPNTIVSTSEGKVTR